MITTDQAREIMRGYMAPRSEAINVFAQTGEITTSLEDELENEIGLVQDEINGEPSEERHRQLVLMTEELHRVVEWLNLTWESEPADGVSADPPESGTYRPDQATETDLADLIRRFDGMGQGANARLGYYGQMRAGGMTHADAVQATFLKYQDWCTEVWPMRDLELPS